MRTVRLARLAVEEVLARRGDAVSARVREEAADIVDRVRREGEPALRDYAERFGERRADEPLVLDRGNLEAAWRAVIPRDRELLERTADRIRRFAEAQRACLTDLEIIQAGLAMGHRALPVDRAGCYAPGGRYPLPSSVLMTVVTARAAGVREVWVASPRPGLLTRAAAWIAGADALLAVGGAHAVAALAYGIGPAPRCDVIVGPGNAWVTAAKALVTGAVRIDGLAGPSELVVVADASADPDRVAADLLAQAEHDPDAVAGVIALDEGVVADVEEALTRRLARLSTAEVAFASLAANGFALTARDSVEAAGLCNRIAPEHLQVMTADPDSILPALRHYGGLFVGDGAAEVLGDYGAGPNHVLPTGGSARSTGGLSVFTFLKVNTWMRAESGDGDAERAETARDAEALARHEGLAGHAESARLRG